MLKIPSTGGPEEGRTRNTASRGTASPTHYWPLTGPFHLVERWDSKSVHQGSGNPTVESHERNVVLEKGLKTWMFCSFLIIAMKIIIKLMIIVMIMIQRMIILIMIQTNSYSAIQLKRHPHMAVHSHVVSAYALYAYMYGHTQTFIFMHIYKSTHLLRFQLDLWGLPFFVRLWPLVIQPQR